jgi:UDP-N-acetylmuramate dehydrogenase
VRIRRNVPFADLTTLRLGGPARCLVDATTSQEIVDAVLEADDRGEPLLILGGGSNLVVDDTGFPGTVIRIGTRGIVERRGGDMVELTVQAGEPWDAVVARTVREGLAGFECLSGIPGLTGATPIQNVGAYGQEVADTVLVVDVLDRRSRTMMHMTAADCGFGYRTSAFKGSDRFVVVAVTYGLNVGGESQPVRYAELARALGVDVGDRAPLADVRETVLSLRRRKGMLLDPADPDTVSAGSFFTNPLLSVDAANRLPAAAPRWPQPDGSVKTSAAWLIERAGFGKGYGNGRVRISTKHTLALTNRGGATTEELLGLARAVRDGVRAQFGVDLVNEPVLVGSTLRAGSS